MVTQCMYTIASLIICFHVRVLYVTYVQDKTYWTVHAHPPAALRSLTEIKRYESRLKRTGGLKAQAAAGI